MWEKVKMQAHSIFSFFSTMFSKGSYRRLIKILNCFQTQKKPEIIMLAKFNLSFCKRFYEWLFPKLCGFGQEWMIHLYESFFF